MVGGGRVSGGIQALGAGSYMYSGALGELFAFFLASDPQPVKHSCWRYCVVHKMRRDNPCIVLLHLLSKYGHMAGCVPGPVLSIENLTVGKKFISQLVSGTLRGQ